MFASRRRRTYIKSQIQSYIWVRKHCYHTEQKPISINFAFEETLFWEIPWILKKKSTKYLSTKIKSFHKFQKTTYKFISFFFGKLQGWVKKLGRTSKDCGKHFESRKKTKKKLWARAWTQDNFTRVRSTHPTSWRRHWITEIKNLWNL